MTTPSTKSWKIALTSAGIIKSQYIDGIDTAVPPTWTAIPDFRHVTDLASINVADYLAGSFDSISLVVISGTLSGSGWSFIAPSTLRYTPPGTGLLTVRMVAAYGSQVVNSNVFTIESVTAQTADVSAPLIPTGFSDTLNGTNQPVLTWKASSDPAPVGQTWSGLKDYGIYRDGALLTRVNAPDAGLKLAATSNLVGTPAITGAAAQAGSTVTMTGGGIDYSNTADQGQYYAGQVTGDFFASGIVTSLVSAYQFSALILDVRASLDTASPHVGLVVFPFIQGKGYQLNVRSVQGGTTTQNNNNALDGATSLRIALKRTGNVFTAYTSQDGLDWIQFSTFTLALPANVYVGLACAALQAGVTASAVVSQFGVTQHADVTYIDNTPGLSGPHSYEITARDLALLESAHSVANTVNVVTSQPTGSLKINYGSYMSMYGNSDGNRQIAIEGPFIDSIQVETSVRGITVGWHWRSIETAQGVYAIGPTSEFGKYFLRAKAAGKYFRAQLFPQVFNTTIATGGKAVPDYMINGSYVGGGQCDQADSVSARWWDANVMTRYIAMWQAIYAMYDSDPFFEGLVCGETAAGFNTTHTAGAAGYSHAALLTQMIRLIVAANAMRTTSNFYISANYLGSDAQTEQLIQAIVANKGYGGGPDTWNRTYVQAGTRALQYDEIMKGNPSRTTSGGYMGKVGQRNEVQSTEIGGYIATFTPAELYDVAYNINHAHYIDWYRQTGTGDGAGTPAQAWSTGVLPFLRNNPNTWPTPPQGYVQTVIPGNPVRLARNPTGAGRRFDVGIGLFTMDTVPWATLIAGDVVNIYPGTYVTKIGLRAQGTATDHVVINGVTDASGVRPIIHFNGAKTATLCNPGGAVNVFTTTPAFGESLGGIVIKRGANDPYGTYAPKYIDILNIDVSGAASGNTYTTLAGATVAYGSAGGFYLLLAEDCLIENCISSDNAFGIFLMTKDDLLSECCKRITVRNSKVYNNGVSGSFFEHNFYMQGISHVVEGCYIGQTRAGSQGSSYKSRTSGEVFCFNYVLASARACDWVHTEGSHLGVEAQTNYGVTYAFGNTIINDANTGKFAVAAIHHGCDNTAEDTGSGSPILDPRNNANFWTGFSVGVGNFLPPRDQLYFWNNTVKYVASQAQSFRTSVFGISLKDLRVDARNNLFIMDGTSNWKWVQFAGQLHLWSNNTLMLLNGAVMSDAHDQADAPKYAVIKHSALLTSTDTIKFVNYASNDLHLTASSPAIDQGSLTYPPEMIFPPVVGYPATAKTGYANPTPTNFPLSKQFKLNNQTVARTRAGSFDDIGAFEYGS